MSSFSLLLRKKLKILTSPQRQQGQLIPLLALQVGKLAVRQREGELAMIGEKG